MPNRYYNHGTWPITQSQGKSSPARAEMDSITTGFQAVQTEMDAKAPTASPTFTGTVTIPSGAIIGSGATIVGFAPLASPALTGTPTAPTASPGTNTTQLATTAFVVAAAFSSALPAQTGNAGKFVTTDGSTASWASMSNDPYLLSSGII